MWPRDQKIYFSHPAQEEKPSLALFKKEKGRKRKNLSVKNARTTLFIVPFGCGDVIGSISMTS